MPKILPKNYNFSSYNFFKTQSSELLKETKFTPTRSTNTLNYRKDLHNFTRIIQLSTIVNEIENLTLNIF